MLMMYKQDEVLGAYDIVIWFAGTRTMDKLALAFSNSRGRETWTKVL